MLKYINNIEDEYSYKLEDKTLNDHSKGYLKNLLRSQNRELRKEAFLKIYGSYSKYGRILSDTLIFNIKKDAFFSNLNKFDSTLQSTLLKDNVNENIYYNLIRTVKKNKNLLHNYVSLRKNILELDHIYVYDLYAPLVKYNNIKIGYEEGKKIILEALKILGSEYLSIVNKIINERWIDVYPNNGKVKDSYTRNIKNVHPYISMNYDNSINGLLTFAHEIGHCVHLYLLSDNYKGNIIFKSEVIAIVNEILLINYFFNSNLFIKKKKLLLNYFLDYFVRILFRQTMFADFEKEIHDKIENYKVENYIDICDIYCGLYKEYYGPTLTLSKEIRFEWTRIPHFYQKFYTYKYPLSFSIAIMLVEKIILDNNCILRNRYMDFLKEDNLGSLSDKFSMFNIDINSLDLVEYSLNMFNKLLDEFKNAK